MPMSCPVVVMTQYGKDYPRIHCLKSPIRREKSTFALTADHLIY